MDMDVSTLGANSGSSTGPTPPLLGNTLLTPVPACTPTFANLGPADDRLQRTKVPIKRSALYGPL